MMHGDDDQIVPFADAGPLSAKLLKKATTRFYPENRKRRSRLVLFRNPTWTFVE
jgi:hypothetical protein